LRKHGLKINLPKSFFGAVEVSLEYSLHPRELLRASTNSRSWLTPSLPTTSIMKSDKSVQLLQGTCPKLLNFVNWTTQSEVIALLKIKNFLKIFEI
jgi:hypothetical protein